MSRPRLDAEQKKVSFSLAFSPNLIAALEKVRGAKSQSVFVEEWLRQHPQIAVELAAMNDPGFVPPIARYEQLMELLLAFYWPEDGKAANARTYHLAQGGQAANACLCPLHCCPPDPHRRSRPDQARTLRGRSPLPWRNSGCTNERTQGNRTARGESLEAVRPRIQEYAHYYYPGHLSGDGKGRAKTPEAAVREPGAWV